MVSYGDAIATGFAGAVIASGLWLLAINGWVDDADRKGRCIERCRPEKLLEVVNDDRECLCAQKRVKLERVP